MQVYVARQPIFNRQEEVFGYELLYRNSYHNAYNAVDDNLATSDVIINSFLNIGIDKISNGKISFINFTEKLLQLKLPTYFNPRDIVVEILETVPIDSDLVSICKELKVLGYKIALDDFIMDGSNDHIAELLQLIDIIKVDFIGTTQVMRADIETAATAFGISLLAEKLETRDGYDEAKRKGYQYFQGYFFERPIIVASHDIPLYNLGYYDIIQQLAKEEPDIDEISKLIEKDISLSYKLLKLINSPAIRPKNKINSIRQSIVLLGLNEIKKWIYLLAIRQNSASVSKNSEEIIGICLTRGKACEQTGFLLKQKSLDSGYFLTGMFSLMDVILGLPAEKIFSELPLNDEIIEALLGKKNHLNQVLHLVIAIEKGKWEEAELGCASLNLDSQKVFAIYKDAIEWSQSLL